MPQRTIPVISSLPQLAQWQASIRGNLKQPVPPPVPANVAVASRQGGNYITWSAVTGADGYRIHVSETGDFSVVLTVFSLPSQQSTAYFDTVPTSKGAAPVTRYYRVNATAGTQSQPQSVQGKSSGTVSSKAISPNDTATNPTTVLDNSNYDALNKGSSKGRYNLAVGVDF